MLNDVLLLLRQELLLTVIIFILLFMKIGKDQSNATILNLVNILLLANFAFGFFFPAEGHLFGSMFRTNALVVLQKNILSLGTLIISLQSYTWLKNHRHVPEFYMLLLSTLLGMYFMIS